VIISFGILVQLDPMVGRQRVLYEGRYPVVTLGIPYETSLQLTLQASSVNQRRPTYAHQPSVFSTDLR